jgi:hypothetical protein
MATKPWLVIGLTALLGVGVGLQLVFSLREETKAEPRLRLAELIAKSASDWAVTDEPIGMTEAVSEAALKTLNLDDFVYRRYRRGGVSFTVYAAYWAAGKMPTRLVASHTPDRCWTENGMRCVDLKFKQTYEVKGRPLLPADWRVFVSGEARTHVVYWHLVEGKLYDYGDRFNAVPHPLLWWKDTLEQATYGSREQLFVRVAAEVPLEQIWSDSGFQDVMESVAKLGLFR